MAFEQTKSEYAMHLACGGEEETIDLNEFYGDLLLERYMAVLQNQDVWRNHAPCVSCRSHEETKKKKRKGPTPSGLEVLEEEARCFCVPFG